MRNIKDKTAYFALLGATNYPLKTAKKQFRATYLFIIRPTGIIAF